MSPQMDGRRNVKGEYKHHSAEKTLAGEVVVASWDTYRVQSQKEIRDAKISPDGSHLCVGDLVGQVTIKELGTTDCPDTNEDIAIFDCGAAVTKLEWHPTTPCTIFVASANGFLNCATFKGYNEASSPDLSRAPENTAVQVPGLVSCIDVKADGTQIAASWDYCVKIWGLPFSEGDPVEHNKAGTLIYNGAQQSTPIDPHTPARNHPRPLAVKHLGGDVLLIAFFGSVIGVNTNTKETIWTANVPKDRSLGQCAVSPDGRHLAATNISSGIDYYVLQTGHHVASTEVLDSYDTDSRILPIVFLNNDLILAGHNSGQYVVAGRGGHKSTVLGKDEGRPCRSLSISWISVHRHFRVVSATRHAIIIANFHLKETEVVTCVSHERPSASTSRVNPIKIPSTSVVQKSYASTPHKQVEHVPPVASLQVTTSYVQAPSHLPPPPASGYVPPIPYAIPSSSTACSQSDFVTRHGSPSATPSHPPPEHPQGHAQGALPGTQPGTTSAVAPTASSSGVDPSPHPPPDTPHPPLPTALPSVDASNPQGSTDVLTNAPIPLVFGNDYFAQSRIASGLWGQSQGDDPLSPDSLAGGPWPETPTPAGNSRASKGKAPSATFTVPAFPGALVATPQQRPEVHAVDHGSRKDDGGGGSSESQPNQRSCEKRVEMRQDHKGEAGTSGNDVDPSDSESKVPREEGGSAPPTRTGLIEAHPGVKKAEEEMGNDMPGGGSEGDIPPSSGGEGTGDPSVGGRNWGLGQILVLLVLVGVYFWAPHPIISDASDLEIAETYPVVHVHNAYSAISRLFWQGNGEYERQEGDGEVDDFEDEDEDALVLTETKTVTMTRTVTLTETTRMAPAVQTSGARSPQRKKGHKKTGDSRKGR